jgi:hypothetical protein
VLPARQFPNQKQLVSTGGRPKGEDMQQQTEFIADLRDRVTHRSLKIEADGDSWKGRIWPKIRLKGSWLERAGFKPGGRVKVTCVTIGVMELRSDDLGLALNERHRP